MNLRQMEAFRAVMLTGSVSEAAKRLFKTQPAVSMMIAGLESEIGFQLFERRKKRLFPTPEANYLYSEVEGIFSRIHDVSETIKDIQNKQHGFLRIGCMPGPSYSFMPDLIADFLDAHPKVQVSMQTRTSEGIKEWTASAQYDLALAEISGPAPSIDQELFDLECVCAVPAGHALANEAVLTPQLLDNQPMITLYADHVISHALNSVFEAAGCRLSVRLRTRFFIPALRFVERGLGVCLMDPITVASYSAYGRDDKIVFKPFAPAVPFRVGILYPAHTPKSRLTQAFAEQVRDRLRSLVPATHDVPGR
ncbi:LysR substrate-binding domain-containing protein [Denitromonas ohlonensis]|uniref:LysR family transcriptional regulator n=2 Tax=Denitromonas TaxID=139331 RepID=A0A557RFP5_9RHOO|nr:LysR substrate-binding domain-containing protein [Denitromonas ohlonensis]TVO63975.1 LysR family transcriptional regulator [Denitromonas ohlonensis]TVO73051.1 LysR family transcriptional regulator [Denitromonas ohlonensis]